MRERTASGPASDGAALDAGRGGAAPLTRAPASGGLPRAGGTCDAGWRAGRSSCGASWKFIETQARALPQHCLTPAQPQQPSHSRWRGCRPGRRRFRPPGARPGPPPGPQTASGCAAVPPPAPPRRAAPAPPRARGPGAPLPGRGGRAAGTARRTAVWPARPRWQGRRGRGEAEPGQGRLMSWTRLHWWTECAGPPAISTQPPSLRPSHLGDLGPLLGRVAQQVVAQRAVGQQAGVRRGVGKPRGPGVVTGPSHGRARHCGCW